MDHAAFVTFVACLWLFAVELCLSIILFHSSCSSTIRGSVCIVSFVFCGSQFLFSLLDTSYYRFFEKKGREMQESHPMVLLHNMLYVSEITGCATVCFVPFFLGSVPPSCVDVGASTIATYIVISHFIYFVGILFLATRRGRASDQVGSTESF